MVKIRLKRIGNKFNAIYRIVVADAKAPRDGKFIEEIGFYNPHSKELKIEMISLDHDAGDYGADYIELLNWLEQKQELCGWIIPTVFEIHSMNVVGAENMKRVIKHNNWKMN